MAILPTTNQTVGQTMVPKYSSLAGLSYSSPLSTTTPTVEPASSTPAVISSSLAADNKTSFGSIIEEQKKQITDQAANKGANNVIKEAKKVTEQEATAGAAKLLNEQNLAAEKLQLEKDKLKALNGGTSTTTEPPTTTTETQPSAYETETTNIQNNLDDATTKFQNATDSLLNGTFPLNPLQQAQLDGMRADFESLITAQKEANKQYEGAIVQSGLTSGRSRYAPEIEAGNVVNSVSQGIQKVSKLDSQMRSALATLESSFQEDNYKLMKQSYDTFKEAQKDKQTNLDNIQKEIKDALEKTEKRDQEIKDQKNDILLSLKESGVSDEIFNQVAAETTVQGMLKAAGSSLIKGSGIIGEYNMYKADEMAAGGTPMSFDEYQTRDANRKVAAAKAALGDSGLSTSQVAILDKANNFLKGETTTKDLNVIQSNYMDMIQNIGKGTGAADMALIFNLMKVLDPNSVVRETEYRTGLDKSGNLFAGKLAQLNSYINPKGGFASESAKQNILSVINTAYENRLKSYHNIRNQEVANAQKLGITNADDYIINYDMSKNMYDEATFDENQMSMYLKMNPDKEALYTQIADENPNLSEYDIWLILEQ